MSAKTSGNLALAVRANLDGSLENLIQMYQDQLYGLALRLLRNPFDAQEVVQDTFLSAYRALTLRYDEERCRNLALRAWLFRIVRNLAYNKLRTRRQIREEPLDPEGKEADQIPEPDSRVDAGDAVDSGLLVQALSILKPSVRELIVLRFIEEMSYAEIAEILRTTEAAARGKVFRALQLLKQRLQPLESANEMRNGA